jgi:hypothetical protein
MLRIESNNSLDFAGKKEIKASTVSNSMKPIFFLIDNLCAQTIKRRSPLSKTERNFVDKFSKPILKAIEGLSNISYSSARSSWKPFQQLIQDISLESHKYRTIELSDVSPYLASLNSSRIPMPGLNMENNLTVNGCSSVILILPTKTKPKRIELLSSSGTRSLFLLKGNEDLHLGFNLLIIR